jgi:hypothetical protein
MQKRSAARRLREMDKPHGRFYSISTKKSVENRPSKYIPGIFFRWLLRKYHTFPGNRMIESQPARPQCDFAVILVVRILAITHQGKITGGKLRPDLMGSAGNQFNFHLC